MFVEFHKTISASYTAIQPSIGGRRCGQVSLALKPLMFDERYGISIKFVQRMLTKYIFRSLSPHRMQVHTISFEPGQQHGGFLLNASNVGMDFLIFQLFLFLCYIMYLSTSLSCLFRFSHASYQKPRHRRCFQAFAIKVEERYSV